MSQHVDPQLEGGRAEEKTKDLCNVIVDSVLAASEVTRQNIVVYTSSAQTPDTQEVFGAFWALAKAQLVPVHATRHMEQRPQVYFCKFGLIGLSPSPRFVIYVGWPLAL